MGVYVHSSGFLFAVQLNILRNEKQRSSFFKLKKKMFSILGTFTVVKFKIILYCIKQHIPRYLWPAFVLVYVAEIAFR